MSTLKNVPIFKIFLKTTFLTVLIRLTYHAIFIQKQASLFITFFIFMQKKHPFEQDKAFFKQLPKQKRAQWVQKMLQTPQQKGSYKPFYEEYKCHDKWDYKGYKMHYHYYQNSQQPQALLFYFHGMYAHGGTSGYITINLARQLNLDVYAQDFMNFGQSQGNCRGLISNFDELIDQAEGFMEFIISKYSQKKKLQIFIAGLSLGGSVCFKLSLKNPQKYKGVILLSPNIRSSYYSQPFLKKLGKVLGMLLPRAKILPQQFQSQNKIEQKQRIEADNYLYKDNHVPATVRTTLLIGDQLSQKFGLFTSPFILIQSGIDKSIDQFAAVDLEESCKSKDKTVIYCKDMWHGMLGEEELEYIVPILSDWIRARL